MRGSALAAYGVLVLASSAHAKPPARTPAHVAPPSVRAGVHIAQPLPMLPSVARVRVEAARDRVLVIEEVNLPRGEWRSGGLDLYVAFGAPGVPVAIDARLVGVPADSLESRPEDAGEVVKVEQAVRRTPSSQPLLGRPQMAGVVVRIPEADLRRTYEATVTAALRIRSLLLSPADMNGVRDVVVRLGIAGDLPLTLGRIQVVSLEGRSWITRAEATLCGPDAETRPLSVVLLPKGSSSRAVGDGSNVAPIAPAMAVRHASDDLCIRWWAAP
jgi:hypothetical protein